MLKLLFNTCLASIFLALSGCYLTPKTPQKVLHLTETDKRGDCVSTGIFTPLTLFETQLLQQRCAEYHPQDTSARNRCVDNSTAIQTVRSVIDYCGAEGSPYFIGINGVTHALVKSGARHQQHPYLTGRFVGKGITVQITNLGLIKKTYQDDSSQTEDNIAQIQFDVRIDVVLDGAKASFYGVLDEGI